MSVEALSLLEELDKLAVNAVSPDRCLRVSLGTLTGLRIDVDPKRQLPRSDAELAKQASATVSGALRAFLEATDAALDQDAAAQPPDSEAVSVRERTKQRDMEIRDVEVAATSPRGLVSVSMRGRSDLDIAVKPRSLDRFGGEVLLTEIRDAVGRALASHHEHVSAMPNIY